MKLELLSPAKNLDFGREAVNHGADALYIGAPAYGARAAATNSLADIDALVRYAHLYGARVYATVNTLLFDDELEPAVAMIRQLYNAGVDALILQDLGLLECDLPPIELHASTQCHNATVERIKFMESVGFSRVILARETSLDEMRAIRQATRLELEAFVHGALCVSYSGQCYLSQYLVGRSGNRGCCSQPCRSSYDLVTADGRTLLRDRHLLSLRDFNASQHLAAMVASGISSFKIEGRLKDLAYLKNITAYYRQLLDQLMDGHERASSGSTTFFFTPDPDRTFNRGYTDYFLRTRQPMANFASPKSFGKYIGKVTAIGRNTFTVSGNEPIANGDGLCFVDPDGHLQGFLVNRVDGRTLTPNQMPDLRPGTPIWRNQDQRFERQLQGRTAERRIGVSLTFGTLPEGFSLTATDVDGLSVSHTLTQAHQPSTNDPAATSALIVKQLSKLGDTPFFPVQITDATCGQYFLPTALLNQLRRETLSQLADLRVDHFRPCDHSRRDLGQPYADTTLDYRANILNSRAEAFYRRHGVEQLERGLEATADYDGRALMTTRYCLRYELGCCLHPERWRKSPSERPLPAGAKTPPVEVSISPSDTLLLRNQNHLLRLQFDCRRCVMCISKA